MAELTPTASEDRRRIMRMRRDLIKSMRHQARIVNLYSTELGLPAVIVVVLTTTGSSLPLDSLPDAE